MLVGHLSCLDTVPLLQVLSLVPGLPLQSGMLSAHVVVFGKGASLLVDDLQQLAKTSTLASGVAGAA